VTVNVAVLHVYIRNKHRIWKGTIAGVHASHPEFRGRSNWFGACQAVVPAYGPAMGHRRFHFLGEPRPREAGGLLGTEYSSSSIRRTSSYVSDIVAMPDTYVLRCPNQRDPLRPVDLRKRIRGSQVALGEDPLTFRRLWSTESVAINRLNCAS
jgi:hypothetical protein